MADAPYSGAVFALSKGEYPAGVLHAEGDEFYFEGKLGSWMETPEQRKARMSKVKAEAAAKVKPGASLAEVKA